jgi:antagonist of KipI
MSALTVIRPGMLTTVQDLGRWGHQGLGVPVAGPMDWYSHRLANQIVGNEPGAAALEMTLIGPELEAEGNVICAVAGADVAISVDGRAVPLHAPFDVPSGSRLRIGGRQHGARATLAVRGGIAVPALFGSRATHLVSAMGPFGGRPVAADARLPIGDAIAGDPGRAGRPLPMPYGGSRLRIMAGPQRDRFTEDAWSTFTHSRYTVTPHSNRMGYRLEGARLTHVESADILSEATSIGTIQVPSSGLPILLMADRQTTGGYTSIATVVTADLPIAGQLAPGDWVEFVACSREQAIAALREREAALTSTR